MDTAEQILVVFLSTALAVLLVVSIIAVVATTKLVKAVQRVTEKAEHIVDDVEKVGETFKSAAGPLAVLRVVNNIMKVVSKHKL